MEEEQKNGVQGETRVIIYLDDASEPLLSYHPPVRFELDTTRLEDGRHRLRVEAYDSSGHKGVRTIPFVVRNGPGIAINGLGDNDVLEGKIPILVNSFGGTGEADWEPSRAETPAPIPTWAWVLVILVVAFGAFFGVSQWNPPPSFAATPTYGPLAFDTENNPGLLGLEGVVAAGTESNTNRTSGAALSDAALGTKVYSNSCASCHQANGQGLPSVFPPLAGDPVITADDPSEHIQIVLNGLQGKTIDGVDYASPMPAFANQLSDEEIAAVINHERSSWGNDAPTVTVEDVAKLRGP